MLSTLLTAGNVEKRGLGLVACLLWMTLAIPSNADDWRLATFNCEFLSRKMVHIKYGLPFELTPEQQWTPAKRESKFRESTVAVAKVIKAINADLIGLTEVGPEEDVRALLAELKSQGLDYPYYRVCQSTDTFTGQHVALLSKHPILKFEPQLTGQVFYTPEPDDPEFEKTARLSKGLFAKVGSPEFALNVYLVHLRSERGGHSEDQERIGQATIVRRHSLGPLQAGEHVVVMGDLNDRRAQPTLMRIRGRDDIFEELIQTGFPKYFPRSKRGTRWTYSYQGQRQQIDHILVSRSLEEVRTLRPSVRRMSQKIGRTKHWASDHRPLILDLETVRK